MDEGSVRLGPALMLLHISTSIASFVGLCSSPSVLSSCLCFSSQHELTARLRSSLSPVLPARCGRDVEPRPQDVRPPSEMRRKPELCPKRKRAARPKRAGWQVRQGGIVWSPYRWESSEPATQTSVQMDRGHSPRTLGGLGATLAQRGPAVRRECNDGVSAALITAGFLSLINGKFSNHLTITGHLFGPNKFSK